MIIAAGAKAAGDERATPMAAAKFAWSCNRDALRKPLADFLYALTHGGRARVEDLGNGASPGASPGDSDANGDGRADGGDRIQFRRLLGIAIVELGWTPDYFWGGATVPEFWAGVDWIAEKNLDAEEAIEEAKAKAKSRPGRRAPHARRTRQGQSMPTATGA